MKTLLLTCFEPFGGQTINPSQQVARLMKEREIHGYRVEVLELPVERTRAIEMALQAVDSLQAAAVVMLGEAGGRGGITPERIAINVDDFLIPDNAGEQPRDTPISTDGPAAYFSTLPIRAIITSLQEVTIPASISNTAGTYLCNRLFYSVMHHLALQGRAIPAGFIHVPFLPEQAQGRWADSPSLPLEQLTKGIQIALEATITGTYIS